MAQQYHHVNRAYVDMQVEEFTARMWLEDDIDRERAYDTLGLGEESRDHWNDRFDEDFRTAVTDFMELDGAWEAFEEGREEFRDGLLLYDGLPI